MLESLPSKEALASFTTLSLYRGFVDTLFGGVAKRVILSPQSSTTLKVICSTRVSELLRGFQPNLLKFLVRTPVQIGSIKFASSITPVSLDPAVRGAIFGGLTSVIEASANNTFNSIATRFVQGQKWSVLKKEPALITHGLSPTVLHRILSNVIYWSVYEKLRTVNPDHPVGNALMSGTVQVCLTAPFFITAVLQQGINPPQENLIPLFRKIVKNQGFFPGLVLPGLFARLVLSWSTSGPFMSLIEKYQIVSRK